MKKAPTRTRKPAKAAPATSPRRQWAAGALVVAVAVAAVALLFGSSHKEPAVERQVMNNYIDLVCSEVLDKLDAANDGDLTGEEAKHLIKVSIPIIQEQTWQPLTDRLTSLQTDGVFDQKQLQAAIAETRKGLQSCKR